MMRKPARLIALASLAVPAAALGQTTYDWVNVVGGAYATSSNWTPAGPPTAASATARFTLDNTYTVTWASNYSINRHLVYAGDVDWYLNGRTFSTTDTTGNLIGHFQNAVSLHITSTGTFNTGSLVVSGGASTSELEVSVSANVNVGAGAFTIGSTGNGSLDVSRNSIVTVASPVAILGSSSGTVGTAIFSDQGTAFNVTNGLVVGSSGAGYLTIRNSAVATANSLIIGADGNSTGSVNLLGGNSSLTVNGSTIIGGQVPGIPAASGTLSIGAGSAAYLGTLALRATGDLNLNGGLLQINGSITDVAPGAQVNFSSSTVHFQNGSLYTLPILDLFLGPSHVLGTGKTLSAGTGTTSLTSPLSVLGGTFAMNTLDLNASVYVGAFGSVRAVDFITLSAGNSLIIDDFGDVKANTLLINNGGLIQLDGPLATMSGQVGNSAGLIQGTGRFKAQVNNTLSGVIRLRDGDHLVFEDFGHANSASIELAGGTIEFAKTLNNLSSGVISGRGTFKGYTSTPGTSVGLSNQGTVMLSAGYSDFYGDINNYGAGKIVAAGGATVTFYDDVTHNGSEIRTVSGARTVFFGSVSGAGPFTGAGTVELEGDLKPGNSPALVTFGGNVEFGYAAKLVEEIGGPSLGSDYDGIQVNNAVSLAGTLQINTLNGYVPSYLQRFQVVRASSISGTFDTYTGRQIAPDRFYVPVYGPGSLELVVAIPGDANIDGSVNFDDLLALAQHYGNGPTEIWQTGDFTGEGNVGFDDLLSLAQNYGFHLLSDDQLGQLSPDFAADWALAQSLVPEPTTTSCLTLVLPLVRRRRTA